MPTIIDELIVRLDLDPKDFDAQRKKATADWLKDRDTFKKTGKDIEDANKKVADSFDNATKSALSLFGVLVGAKGLTEFAARVTVADAAVGRLSNNLGMAPQRLQAWEAAVQRFGGSSGEADSAIGRANDQLQNLLVNGQRLPDSVLRLGAMANVNIDTSHGLSGYLQSIGAAANAGSQIDRARTAYLLNQSGFGGAFGNVLMQQGGAGLNGYLNSMPAVSDETIKRMQELQTQWTTIQEKATQFASTLWGDLEPALKPFLGDLDHFLDDLIKLEPTLAVISTDAGKVADALGGWRVAIEGLLALWAGGKIVGMLSAVRGLLGLGGAVAGTAGAAAGGGILGPIAAAAVGMSGGPLVESNGDFQAQLNDSKLGPPNARAKILSWASAYIAAKGNTSGSRVAQLRAIAIAAGIDPDKFVALAKGEGLGHYVGDNGSSFGDFQLHMGGLSASMPGPGLGDEFMAQTGLDPRDPSTWAQQAQFAAAYIRKHGASKWSAARKLGITNMTAAPWWSGMSGLSQMSAGGQWGALGGHSVNVSINTMHVNAPQAKDAAGIAGNLAPALKRSMGAQPANYGPN